MSRLIISRELKKFFFTETVNFELRLEVVNLFNTVNLGNPDTFLGTAEPNGTFDTSGRQGALGNSGFGKITSTAFFGNDLQRNLQFAFRLNF